MWSKIKNYVNEHRLNVQSHFRKLRLQKTLKEEQIYHLQKTVVHPHVWYGSSYGGFYIYPDCLDSSSVVYSFGIGKDISFDLECIRRHGCVVHAFDPTPKSSEWIIDKNLPLNFYFHNYGISDKSGFTEFFIPERKISGSLIRHAGISKSTSIRVEMKCLQDILKELDQKKLDVLKMDIEGSEYEVLERIGEVDVPIDQILVEFHDRIFDNGVSRSRKVVKILRNLDFEILAASSTFEEVSFIHKRLL